MTYTYKDLLKITHPERVSDIYHGGCKGCPGTYFPGAQTTGACSGSNKEECERCWNKPLTTNQVREALGLLPFEALGMKPIIEKKKKPEWVISSIGYDVATFYPVVRCSACNKSNGFMATPYCPYCGAKMANPIGAKEGSDDV